ncbi:MAG: hypothetical protein ACOYUZ_04460 [Patescibacteria group bacterium]
MKDSRKTTEPDTRTAGELIVQFSILAIRASYMLGKDKLREVLIAKILKAKTAGPR